MADDVTYAGGVRQRRPGVRRGRRELDGLLRTNQREQAPCRPGAHAECYQPDDLLRRTRAAEERDPAGVRWPRNKKSDGATIAYVEALHVAHR